MNYEEMLNAQEGVAQHKELIPLGTFYRKQIERKYRNVVELKPMLADSLLFCEGLRRDQQLAADLKDAHQLRYELHEDSGGVYELELQQGNFLTLAQLLNDEPAAVAAPGFVKNTIDSLMDITMMLNGQGVYHLCFAPQFVFVRKGDRQPMLLCHGSSFLQVKGQAALYEGFEQFVAPEVLADDNVDERSDVYALGRFMEYLYAHSDMPLEYKAVVKKATAEEPDKRYSSVSEMRQAMTNRHGMRRTALMALAALAVVAVVVWAVFDLVPESSNIEFVDNNGLMPKADPFAEDYDTPYDADEMGEYMDPEIALYLDSIRQEPMSEEEVRRIADSLSVANNLDRIFRRRFEERANSKLQGLYTNNNLGSSESNFIAHSQQVMQDLMDYAVELSEQTGISPDHASSLATEIISHLQAEMQGGVTRYGSMTQSSDDE